MGMAPTKSQQEGENTKRHHLKKSVPEGSFSFLRIRKKPNKITAYRNTLSKQRSRHFCF
jgi:hypothetical protein